MCVAVANEVEGSDPVAYVILALDLTAFFSASNESCELMLWGRRVSRSSMYEVEPLEGGQTRWPVSSQATRA